ncbi:hypothetical protein [Salipaludibacillus daqingensis]|uniref:hypothetical protein n=1 Tax=Salipaludibacillus daqingensis TaxID=3041001 RepID=UPI00247346E5|nr:hypothetical protein [Salipaludibacillus daqingensis]
MKHIIPFVLIGLIVVGVMIFLQDDYAEPFRPDLSDEMTKNDWIATFYINDLESEDATIGVKLDYSNENISIEDMEAIEFFVETEVGGFFFQDLQITDFDGEIAHEEECEQCQDFSGEEIHATAIVNWRVNGETKTEHYQFQLNRND